MLIKNEKLLKTSSQQSVEKSIAEKIQNIPKKKKEGKTFGRLEIL